jgi:hypothetical protein
MSKQDNVYCVYRHLKPNGEVFYIGIGSNLKRPYKKSDRSKYWKNKVKKYPDYEVQILTTGLTKEDACELEQILISWYKREDCCGGTLVNLTDGGESTYGRIMEDWQREKMSIDRKGKSLGKDNPNYGNKWSDEKRKYMSELKKEGHKNGTLVVNKEALKKGREETQKRYEENPQLKINMRKKVSENHNLYEYLKIDRETKEVIEVFQNRLELLEKYPDYATSPLLSVCNGWKSSYKGFLWRYRIRETGEIIEPICKYCKKL